MGMFADYQTKIFANHAAAAAARKISNIAYETA